MALKTLVEAGKVVPVLDEIDQQIEIAGDQRQLGVAARERPSTRRDNEITEPVTRHNVGTDRDYNRLRFTRREVRLQEDLRR